MVTKKSEFLARVEELHVGQITPPKDSSVEISDLAKAVLALETDRVFIHEELSKSQETQREILRKALSDCAEIALRSDWLTKRLAAVDEAIQKILQSKVVQDGTF